MEQNLWVFQILEYSIVSITRGKFPTPWGVTVSLGDERIHTQQPQRDSADVPLCISSEVQKSGVYEEVDEVLKEVCLGL